MLLLIFKTCVLWFCRDGGTELPVSDRSFVVFGRVTAEIPG
jgi:hypothetical protein